MDDPLVCKMCGELYKDPLILSCGHSCCAACCDHMIAFSLLRHASSPMTTSSPPSHILASKRGKVELSCPTCTVVTEVVLSGGQQNASQVLRHNRDLADECERRFKETSKVSGMMCQMDCGRAATVYCSKCNHTIFCSDCFRIQHSTGVFRQHEPHAFDSAQFFSGNSFSSSIGSLFTCSEHSNQDLALFCLVCKRPVCLICAQFSKAHKGHECAALVEHGEECRQRITSGLTELEKRREVITRTLEGLMSRKHVSGQAIQEAKDEISATFIKIENALKLRQQELLRNLELIAGNDEGNLQHALRDTLDFITALQSRFGPLAKTPNDASAAQAALELDAQLRKSELNTNALATTLRTENGLVQTTRVRINTDNVLREIKAIGFIERTLSIDDPLPNNAQSTSTTNNNNSISDEMKNSTTAITTTAAASSTLAANNTMNSPTLNALNNALPPQMPSSIRFHLTQHGPYVIVSDGGRKASRSNPQDRYNNSVIALSDPLPPGMHFIEVTVNEITRKWAGSLSLRFYTELVQPLPPCIQTNLLETFGVELSVGDRVGLGLDTEGKSLLYIKGKCLGHITMFPILPTDRPLFACIDLYGKVNAVTIHLCE